MAVDRKRLVGKLRIILMAYELHPTDRKTINEAIECIASDVVSVPTLTDLAKANLRMAFPYRLDVHIDEVKMVCNPGTIEYCQKAQGADGMIDLRSCYK